MSSKLRNIPSECSGCIKTMDFQTINRSSLVQAYPDPYSMKQQKMSRDNGHVNTNTNGSVSVSGNVQQIDPQLFQQIAQQWNNNQGNQSNYSHQGNQSNYQMKCEQQQSKCEQQQQQQPKCKKQYVQCVPCVQPCPPQPQPPAPQPPICTTERVCFDIERCRQPREDVCGCAYPYNIISVRDPQSRFIIPSPTVFRQLNAQRMNTMAVSSLLLENVDFYSPLVDWSADIIVDSLGSFNKTTGIFTAFSAGEYSVRLIVNWFNPFFIRVEGDMTPYVELYNPATGARYLASFFTVSSTIQRFPDSEDPILAVSYLDRIGTLTIDAVLQLAEGQQIGIRASNNGVTYSPENPLDPAVDARIILNPPNADTTFTVQKLRNIPGTTVVIT